MAAVETPRTEVRAEARYVRTAPRKAQLVAEQIRGRTVPEARTILAFTSRDAARDMEKVLNSAVANAEANHGLVGDDMLVSGAFVGAGPVLKRWRARARGRVARIRKRTCHITIELAPADGSAIPEPRQVAVAAPEAPAPEEAKPKRAARKKAEPAETAETTEAADEAPKPKRTRAAKPKADAEAATEEEPKPKRTRTAKPKADAEAKAADKPKRTTTRRKKADEEKES